MSSTENGYRRVLRPEACPLAYDRLDTSQKDGFVRITQALQDAVDSLPDKRPKPEQPANQWNPWMPEKDRKSKVVFLSGERGTGKTTLMLTVLQHFLDQDGSKIAPAPELKVRLHDLSRRIIWLAPIDMEPLPQPSNLYAAILARIEHALDHQVKSADEGERERPDSECFPGILDPRGQGPYRDCLKRLRMLQRDVSTAWNGNLRERAGDLDTEDYFHEVVRSERARVNLTRDLDDLLDHLAWCAPWRGRLENPLFVLPIDDIDLNPEHAVDLLHLLRTLASKRLFTLVLGDIAQMERVLQYKIAGTLSKLRGGIRVGDRSLLQEALETAGEGLRKLIPPGQRIRLATMVSSTPSISILLTRIRFLTKIRHS